MVGGAGKGRVGARLLAAEKLVIGKVFVETAARKQHSFDHPRAQNVLTQGVVTAFVSMHCRDCGVRKY